MRAHSFGGGGRKNPHTKNEASCSLLKEPIFVVTTFSFDTTSVAATTECAKRDTEVSFFSHEIQPICLSCCSYGALKILFFFQRIVAATIRDTLSILLLMAVGTIGSTDSARKTPRSSTKTRSRSTQKKEKKSKEEKKKKKKTERQTKVTRRKKQDKQDQKRARKAQQDILNADEASGGVYTYEEVGRGTKSSTWVPKEATENNMLAALTKPAPSKEMRTRAGDTILPHPLPRFSSSWLCSFCVSSCC